MDYSRAEKYGKKWEISPQEVQYMYKEVICGNLHSSNNSYSLKETKKQAIYRKLSWMHNKEMKKKYKKSTKYYNNILKMYNRQLNKYQTERVSFSKRKYVHDFTEYED